MSKAINLKKKLQKNTRMGIEGGEKQKSEKERDVGGGGGVKNLKITRE